jgi:hypothetical protein
MLVEQGLHARRPLKKFFIRPENKIKRLEWAQKN